MNSPAKNTIATVIPALRYRNALAMNNLPSKASGYYEPWQEHAA